MRKFLPLIAIGVGILVLGGGFFFVRSRKTVNEGEQEPSSLIEVPLEKRPVASLTPTVDGHWLNLKIEKIMIEGASSLDYELLYSLPDGRTQGVPGSVKLKGNSSFERELLLGSESSGKFRYDEGVEEGTFTLRFRSEKGKLIAKFSTNFTLTSSKKGVFELTMDTFADGTKTFSSK